MRVASAGLCCLNGVMARPLRIARPGGRYHVTARVRIMVGRAVEHYSNKMKFSRLCLFPLVLVLIQGCRSDVLLSEQRSFPKKPKFTIVPENYTAASGLDFNAVYYFHIPKPANSNEPVETYYFLRFWPNGRVLKRYVLNHLPNKADAENFKHAYVGYYRVQGQNLVTELYIQDPTAWIAWDHNRHYAVINGDNITFSREEMRGQSLYHEATYRKIHLDQLERMPDW
jgi:hypothetical protein